MGGELVRLLFCYLLSGGRCECCFVLGEEEGEVVIYKETCVCDLRSPCKINHRLSVI